MPKRQKRRVSSSTFLKATQSLKECDQAGSRPLSMSNTYWLEPRGQTRHSNTTMYYVVHFRRASRGSLQNKKILKSNDITLILEIISIAQGLIWFAKCGMLASLTRADTAAQLHMSNSILTLSQLDPQALPSTLHICFILFFFLLCYEIVRRP